MLGCMGALITDTDSIVPSLDSAASRGERLRAFIGCSGLLNEGVRGRKVLGDVLRVHIR